MNNNPFVKAVKEQVKGRVSITGPSGSGKTWTALLMATKLVGLEGGRIALLDTEGQSSKRYASDFDFDVIDLEGDFNPQHYIDMIKAAGEHGYTVLIIDSLSHAWNGSGGVLAIVDKSQMGKNKMSGWIKGRPAQQSLSDAIVQTPVHLICTMRSKTEWDMSKNEQGKISPQKIGLAPVQSSDMEYEFDIAFMLDQQHKMMVSKSRCAPLNDQGNEFTDVEYVTETIYAWLTDGIAPTPLWANQESVKEIFVGFRDKGLSDNEIMGFADVDKWNNYAQWGKYESQEDAIEHINAIWNVELDIDREQGPPDSAFEHDSSVDDAMTAAPSSNGYDDTFHFMSYIGIHSNLQFSTHEPGTENNTTVVCYGGRGEIKKWGGAELAEQLDLAQYDKIKDKDITSAFIPMAVPVEFYFDDDQSNSGFDFKITGIKGDPIIPY